MKVRLLLLFFISFFVNETQAQKFNVSWGDNTRIKHDYEDAVPIEGNKFIVLKFKNKAKYNWTKGYQYTYHPILLLVDKNMETIKEEPIEIPEKDASFIKFEKYGKNLFYIYESYNKSEKTTSVHARKIDTKTLATSQSILLGTYSSDGKSDQAEPSYVLSKDSSKVLLFVEGPERKNEKKKFYLGVFDNNLNAIWKKDVELSMNEKFVSIYDYEVINDGKVIVAIKHYDKEVTRQSVREDGIKIPSYTYKMLVYENENSEPRELNLNLNNHYIQGTKVTYNQNGSLTIAGLYKVKANGRVTGAFYSNLDLNTIELINPMMVVFPIDLIEKIDKDGFGSDKQKDPGLSNNFRIMNIVNRENGSVDLIAEYYRLDVMLDYNTTTKTTSYRYEYTYGDIVNTNIDVDGNATFTRIPKRQKMTNSQAFLGFYPLVFGDKLVLLYNDDRDNVERDINKKPDDVVNFKRSVFMAATIDVKGNVKRTSLYDHRDEDYISVPKSIVKVSNNSYLISSYLVKMFKRRTRFGVLKVS